MMNRLPLPVLAACLVVSGCGPAGEAAPAPRPVADAAAASAPASSILPAPVAAAAVVPVVASATPMVAGLDVGRTTTQATRAPGTGKSLADAVNDAIRTAILQVNGTSIDLRTEQFRFALDAATAYSDVNIRATGFADVVQQRSRGAITGFKLESAEGPDTSGRYKVWIEAQVARYSPPAADMAKPKLVVAPLRFDAKSFTVGGRTVPAQQVAEDIRQRVVASLAQTGRFAVLDRAFDAEVQQELDMVESGETPNSQFGRLGQAFSADLVWIGRIRTFSYARQVRVLRATDRELVSHAGGWSLTQKLVNATTRQTVLANDLQGRLPSTAPTTLGDSVDSEKTLRTMQDAMAREVVTSIMSSSFPVSVVSRDGNAVILSQGAQALQVGARHQVVALGQELKDPQTGQSLGRTEAPCCEVVVDRVTPTLAYGHLEGVSIALDQVPAGGLLVRERITRSANPAAGAANASPARATGNRRSRDSDDVPPPSPDAGRRKGSDGDW